MHRYLKLAQGKHKDDVESVFNWHSWINWCSFLNTVMNLPSS